MRETRDLGIQEPQWHSLLFEEQVAGDMRVVCRQDVKTYATTASSDGLLEEMCGQAQV